MLKDILAPLSTEDFFRDYWTREFLHISGPADKFDHLYSWDVLNSALDGHRFDAKRLVLFRSGKRIEPERYLNGSFVHSGKLINELQNGATLIFNNCEETHPPLKDFCTHLEWLFHKRVIVNLYAGWRRDHGFNVHWDDQDTLILQVAGKKRWKVWKATRLHPFKEDVVDTSVPPEGDPVWDEVLEPGSLLSIPRGVWHVAYPLDEPCLHLTVTIQNLTGIDLLHWLADQMKSSDTARMPIPIMATPEERAGWLERIRTDLAAAWDKTLPDRYLAEVDAKAVPRPRLSLPSGADPRNNALRRTTLLELATPRPLQFSVRGGKTWCYASGFTWPMDADVAEKLRGFNDRHPHTINELSPAPDLRLSALVGTMVMNGVLRRCVKAEHSQSVP